MSINAPFVARVVAELSAGRLDDEALERIAAKSNELGLSTEDEHASFGAAVQQWVTESFGDAGLTPDQLTTVESVCAQLDLPSDWLRPAVTAPPAATAPPIAAKKEDATPKKGFQYHMVQLSPNLVVSQGNVAGAAASYLQQVVDEYASKGWEFYSIESFSIIENPGCGCLAGLLGAKPQQIDRYVAVFRAPRG